MNYALLYCGMIRVVIGVMVIKIKLKSIKKHELCKPSFTEYSYVCNF